VNEYHERNKNLAKLGFLNYREYLRSNLWRSLRKDAFRIFGKKCIRCRGKANQIHHRSYTYEALQGLWPKHLVPVCARCHKFAEYRDDGSKRSPGEANSLLSNNHKKKHKKNKNRKIKIDVNRLDIISLRNA